MQHVYNRIGGSQRGRVVLITHLLQLGVVVLMFTIWLPAKSPADQPRPRGR